MIYNVYMVTVLAVIIFIILLIPIISIFCVINRWRRNMALLHSVTDTHRGTKSERNLIIQLLKNDIPATTVFHDLYVERCQGQYSQIDAVVITRVGIIVFEVKDYSGWIFGNGYQKNWTQVFAYGKKKHQFYNPVHQNRGHIEALKQKLEGIADVPLYSVVVFYGSCRLRNIRDIPNDAYVGYARHVESIIADILDSNPSVIYNDERGVINVLKEAVANGGNSDIVRKHIQNVRNYVG